MGRKRKSHRAKRGVHISPKCSVPIKYRSGWELAFATYLDGLATVISYEYEPYPIRYISNVRTGRSRNYWPDFEVTRADGTKLLVEIKPHKKLKLPLNVKKAAAAADYAQKNGIQYMAVTEIELKALGLLA